MKELKIIILTAVVICFSYDIGSQIVTVSPDSTTTFKRNFAGIGYLKILNDSEDAESLGTIISINMPLIAFQPEDSYRTVFNFFLDYHVNDCDSFIKLGSRFSLESTIAKNFGIRISPGISFSHDRLYRFGYSNQLALSYKNRFDLVAQYDVLFTNKSRQVNQFSLGAKLRGSKLAPFAAMLVGIVAGSAVGIARSK